MNNLFGCDVVNFRKRVQSADRLAQKRLTNPLKSKIFKTTGSLMDTSNENDKNRSSDGFHNIMEEETAPLTMGAQLSLIDIVSLQQERDNKMVTDE